MFFLQYVGTYLDTWFKILAGKALAGQDEARQGQDEKGQALAWHGSHCKARHWQGNTKARHAGKGSESRNLL